MLSHKALDGIGCHEDELLGLDHDRREVVEISKDVFVNIDDCSSQRRSSKIS